MFQVASAWQILPLVTRANLKPEARRILVVEDDEDSGLMLRYLLQLAGHDVRLARSGCEGLAVATTWCPEILISDLGLPGDMDGYALAHAVRADSRSASAFLMALSGFGRGEDKARTRAAGFHIHLTKPVDMEALEAAIACLSGMRGSARSPAVDPR